MKLLKIIIPCVLLGACVFGTSKNAKFYTLRATDTSTISADFAAFVGVNRVRFPKYLDRPQIVTQRKDSAQVNISEYNRWVESIAVLATRVLTEDLSASFPMAQIKINQLKGEGFERTISVEVEQISAVLGDQAELIAWYTIKDKSGQVLAQQKFTGAVKIGKTYDELAQGYSILLAQLSQEIARALVQK